MSFVGLMAPHAAHAGLRRALPQLLGATLLGMLVMVVGDWLGRNLIFPRPDGEPDRRPLPDAADAQALTV